MQTIQSATETTAVKNHKCDFCLGIIKKGSKYLKSVHKHDEIYTWKSHWGCAEIADKLNMYDNCDDGLTSNDFVEIIQNAYDEIMSSTQNELYESKNFVVPDFEEKLQFVLSHYKIEK